MDSTFKVSIPLFEIFLFLGWQKFVTGYFSATYDPYALSQLEFRFMHQAVMITQWFFIYQERYIFSLLIAANMILNRAARQRSESLLFLLIFLATYLFSFIYPYFLPRYLLLMLLYLYLLGVGSVLELIKPIVGKPAAALIIVAFMIWSLANQPFIGNAEVNLRYLDVISVHKDISQFIAARFPASRIVTGCRIRGHYRRRICGM